MKNAMQLKAIVKNIAKEKRISAQLVLQNYMLERFLERVSLSQYRIIIQSPMGGIITPADIAKKVPKGAVDVYVRVDENKLYYVLKNGESGDVDIWE